MRVFLSSTNSPLAISPLVGGLLTALLVFLILVVILRIIRKRITATWRIPAALQQQILLISLPRESLREGEGKPTPELIQKEIGVAENLFSILGSLVAQRGLKVWLAGRTDHFSFEMVAQNNEILFYAAVPNYLTESLRQQIHAVYPRAQIEEAPDYNIFSAQGAIVGTYLKLGREFIFPIKTYKKMEGFDPLEVIINPLSRVAAADGVAVQFIIRSAYKKWHLKGVRVAREVHQGKTVTQALSRVGFGGTLDRIFRLITFFFSFFNAKSQEERDKEKLEEPRRLSAMEEEAIKGIEEKTSKAGLDVNIRMVASAATKVQAKGYLDNLVNAFGEYNIYQYGNGLKRAASVNLNKLISDFIHRSFNPQYKLILNSEEMASLWHLPLPTTEAPNIHWLAARKAQPPINLPPEGIILGENIYRGTKTLVRIKNQDRQRHLYIIGKSGTGKSVLQENMIVQDIKQGEGVCVIDPHGDSVEAVLEHIPNERLDDVIIFDPADYERPIGINMLEFHNPEQKTFVINEMIKIFDKLYDLKTTGGPMFEQYMRNAMMLMMEDKDSGATLLEVPKVLADPAFRRYKLSKCLNPVVKDFWEKEAEKAGGEASLANMVPYITSKLTPFIASDLMRPIIAQQQSSFNFREVMDSGKILLVKLSKGVIGEMSCNLLGMIMVGKILMAALSRVELPVEQRRNFYLYIDEFQNFTTDTIAVILSEARKYKLCLTIAHQYIGQLVKENDTSIRDAVFGNVGTIITFRIGPEDAEIIAKQLAPVFNDYDVINIPKYNAYIKLLIDNQNPPAFNIKTLAPQAGDKAMVQKVKELSRLKYGRDRNTVEREILARVNITT